MFDFAWSEIALIGAVALILIGPKDMPAAIRTITSMIKKARRMAAEFQTHVDEMVREAELGDVKKAFNDIRNFDISGAMERTVDPDRSLRRTFEEDPFKPTYPTPSEVSTLDEAAVTAPAAEPIPAPEPEPPAEPAPTQQASPPKPAAPDWVPPSLVPPPQAEATTEPSDEPPAWVPPAVVAQRRNKV
ncbi:MAG TPA: Sec-independent protein translocase protein TatB [Rhodopila sp.]|nr:Sec-independent protein translocase protein TatB [Rhodopila sp.]